MKRWLFARRASRTLRRWVLMAARRVTPVLRVPNAVQRLLVGWQVLSARVRGVFRRPRQGEHVLLKPRLPEKYKPLVLVFEAQAARHVLADRDQYQVKNYDEKMKKIFGRFFLGIDYHDPEYEAQAKLWREITDGRDANMVFALANAAAKMTDLDRCDHAKVDVVDWSARTLERFVKDYFGVPPFHPSNGAPGNATLRLFQRVSSYVFNLDVMTEHLADDAVEAGDEVKRHLTNLLNRKLESPEKPQQDVVDRLLAQTKGSEEERNRIVALLGGTLSGLFVPTSSQFVSVVDHLLDLAPHHLSTFKGIAIERSRSVALQDDHQTTLATRYVLEAARFAPFPFGLIRHCEEGTRLPTASGRLKRIPEKSNVVALMGSVAFDPLLAAQPGAFLTGRPPAHSLVFGTGQHHCIGAKNSWPIAPTLMTEMALRLFALPGLRRARGRKGTLRSSGSWPASFELEYDPDPVRGTP